MNSSAEMSRLQSDAFQFPGRPLPLARRLAVRNRVVSRIREFMTERHFNEVPVPAIAAHTGTWAATGRFYLDSMIAKGFPAVWCENECLPPDWAKHEQGLMGFRRIEAEMVDLDLDQLCALQEDLLKSVAADLGADILGGRQVTRLDRMITAEHPRLTYTECLQILGRRGWSLTFGETIPRAGQTSLWRYVGSLPLLVTHFPVERMFFTTRVCPEDPRVTLSADYILPYAAATMDGAVRETDPLLLANRLNRRTTNEPDFSPYLQLFKDRPLNRAGFGLGVTSLLQYLMGLESPRDAMINPQDWVTMNHLQAAAAVKIVARGGAS